MNDGVWFAARAGCIGLVLLLGACSGGNPLSTGALLGSPEKKAAEPPPQTITDRVVYVGTTSARAQRCGYVFDPASVRQSFLASEAQQGAAADALAKAEKSYDYTHATVLKSISSDADYCSEGQTQIIKRDLTQILAGNFADPSKSTLNVGWWSRKNDTPIDREKLFKPGR